MNNSLVLSENFVRTNKSRKYYKINNLFFSKDSKITDIKTKKYNLSKKNLDLFEKNILSYYLKILKKLSEQLNQIHNTEISEKQWEIIIGNWLRFFIEVAHERWISLDRINLYEFNEIIISKSEKIKYRLIPKNRSHFSNLVQNSSSWNDYIYSKVITHKISRKKINIKTIPIKKIKNIFYKYKKNNLLKRFILKFSKIISYLAPPRYRMLVSITYLPFKDLIILIFKLRKLPIFYFPIGNKEFARKKIIKEREYLLLNLFDKRDKFGKFLQDVIADQIPQCYLENWNELNNELKRQSIPRVNMILAGNGFDNDEIIRLYISKHILNLTYIIFQHGGVYGLSYLTNKGEFYEKRVADYWFSWGWKDKNFPNVIEGYNFKNTKNKKLNNTLAENILIPMPYFAKYRTRLKHIDENSLNDDLDILYMKLDIKIRDKLRFRPFPESRNIILINKAFDKKLIDNEQSIIKSLTNSRLHISIVNATTFLESLSYNIPTILFIKEPLTEFRKNSHNDILKLKKAGILYDDLDKLILFLNQNYKQIRIWWNTKKVQTAVCNFKKNYSKESNNWLNDILYKISSKI